MDRLIAAAIHTVTPRRSFSSWTAARRPADTQRRSALAFFCPI
jgi:hypothetical protein